MREKIVMKPIGVIRTPYGEAKGMPIQGKFKDDVVGRAELFPEYRDGLKDVDGFSHLILIYHFNRATEERIQATPYLENETHGIFAIRSPWRPNHLGISIVRVKGLEEGAVLFTEVDILDNTPLIDIKPYVSIFDAREGVRNGWIGKYFEGPDLPATVINPGRVTHD